MPARKISSTNTITGAITTAGFGNDLNISLPIWSAVSAINAEITQITQAGIGESPIVDSLISDLDTKANTLRDKVCELLTKIEEIAKEVPKIPVAPDDASIRN